jgi:prepilin-type N-terminal cleavage/methylation domain-containing protein
MRSFRRKLAGLRPGGFTLVELAVVSAILAGLAVAVVTYVGSTSQTVNTEMTATVDEVRTGVDTSGLGQYSGGAEMLVLTVAQQIAINWYAVDPYTSRINPTHDQASRDPNNLVFYAGWANMLKMADPCGASFDPENAQVAALYEMLGDLIAGEYSLFSGMPTSDTFSYDGVVFAGIDTVGFGDFSQITIGGVSLSCNTSAF